MGSAKLCLKTASAHLTSKEQTIYAGYGQLVSVWGS